MPTPDTQPRHDPFSAIPIAVDDVQSYDRDNQRVQLWRPIPPKSMLGRFLARRLGFKRFVRVNLDERGTSYWRLVDGQHSLHDIERHLRTTYAFDQAESKEATVEFTKILMLRGLIGLRLADGQVVAQHPTAHDR
jgi:hypothetical protein